MMKLLPMVVVFEVPFEPVKVTIGDATPICPLSRSCAPANFGRTADAVNNAVAKTWHIPLIFMVVPPPALGRRPSTLLSDIYPAGSAFLLGSRLFWRAIIAGLATIWGGYSQYFVACGTITTCLTLAVDLLTT